MHPQNKHWHIRPAECQCYIQDNVFKNGPSEICGRQPLEISSDISLHHLVHSWILYPYNHRTIKLTIVVHIIVS